MKVQLTRDVKCLGVSSIIETARRSGVFRSYYNEWETLKKGTTINLHQRLKSLLSWEKSTGRWFYS